jgi:O-antigen ligase
MARNWTPSAADPLQAAPVLILSGAAVMGALAGVAPAFAVAATVGAVLAAVMASSLTRALGAFAVLVSIQELPGAPAFSIAKVVGLMLALVWLGGMVVRAAEQERTTSIRDQPALVLALVVLLGWSLVSTVWARNPGTALVASSSLGLNLVLYPILFAALRRPADVRTLYGCFVGGLVLSSVIGVLSPSAPLAPDEIGRLPGAGLGPNLLGLVLIGGVVLAATLAASKALSAAARCVAGVAMALCVLFLLMTVSREALLGLGVSVAVTPFLIGRERRLVASGTLVMAVLAVVLWFLTLASPTAVERFTRHDPTGSGRIDIWTIAERMISAHPVLGVGAGNFPESSVHYLLQPGTILRAEYIVDRPKVPHNIYLQVTAELGFLGLALFALTLLLSVSSGLLAARRYERLGDQETALLARGLVIALVGMLTAAFFSSQVYNKPLWLLLAAGPALLAMARRASDDAGGRTHGRAQDAPHPAVPAAHAL